MGVDASVVRLDNDEVIELPEECQQFTIPVGQLRYFDEEEGKEKELRIDDWALYFLPGCKDTEGIEKLGEQTMSYERDPFYGSVTPIAYTAAATTVMSWLLLLLLFLSQQYRPMLQKAATLGIAISLTVSLVDTTNSLQEQYKHGYQDADQLRSDVYNGTVFQTLRIISGVILWFSHIQVALRLYKRTWQRNSIKVVGTVLIVLDLIVQCLANFYKPVTTYSSRFQSPLYILLYVVELVILVIYAVIVIIYSIHKKDYAFNHKALAVGCISIASLLLPIAFVTMGVANYWLAGWTGFATRVCSISATVIIWGWIDIIERIESDQLKAGVMGRRIEKNQPFGFDSDSNADPDNNHENDNLPTTANNNNNNNNNSNGSSSGGDGSRRFPWTWFKSHWIISRGGSANSGSTSYGQPITVPTAQTGQVRSSNSSDDTSPAIRTSTANDGLTRHVHPVRRNYDRTPNVYNPDTNSSIHLPHSIDNEEIDLSQTIINQSDTDDDDEEYYVVTSTNNHRPFTQEDEEPSTSSPPPDLFPPLPNFDPGDYWDEKASPPNDFN
ncbi:hypothetical protein TRICI_003337 [Trichomonascus ciferrii]|uniref:pH-response regulator protein palH/RIM21 n=1 Tax=Trichomonascus ciferrii TaxID=44093 RepID=A0A642V3H9_9ASCO|nr:hypothetical protein TRICI_003337 [Trichomonascus ciferrii]